MDDDLVQIGIWVKIFFVCIFGLGTAMGFFIFFSGSAFFTKASGAQASLLFSPDTLTLAKGKSVKIKIMADTNKAYARGIDVVATFDPTVLMVQSIIPTAQKDTELKTFLPLDLENKFNYQKVIGRANSDGKIEFSAIAADILTNRMRSSVSGNFVLAEVEFFVKKEMNTTVVIQNKRPSQDSTVVEDINPPMNILTKTNILYIFPPLPTPTPIKNM